MGKIGKFILWGLLILVVIFGIKSCNSYNRMVELDEGVKKQWANVENVYQRRTDLVSSLVSTIKGSAKFEKNTLVDVVEARAKATSVNINANELSQENISRFQEAQSQLSSQLSRLLVTVERYPDLKTTQQFQDMNAELAGTENRIAQERMNYNKVAQEYNMYVRRFPQILFAGMFGFSQKGYFQAEVGADKPVDINFDE